MRILVVEEEPQTLELLQTYCRVGGHELSVAADTSAAAAQLESVSPDLVLLDLSAAHLGDWQLLKTVHYRSCAGVILLAAVEDLGDIGQGLALGGDDYLAKPFDQAELDARVRALLVTLRLAPGAGKRRRREPPQFNETLVSRRVL